MTLISDNEMDALRGIAQSGMVTTVYIQIRVTSQTAADGWSETYVEQPPILGWIYEFTPGTASIGIVAGSMGLAEVSWLRVPVGTVVHTGDRVRIGTEIFTIQHTNESSTYQPWVACAMRIVI